MRLTIRDLLWFVVLSVAGALFWRDRVAIKNERASLKTQKEMIRKERRQLQEDVWLLEARERTLNYEIDYCAKQIARHYRPPPSNAEIEAANRRSAELGAPQAKPLPGGYGQKPL
jgi:hypothetical protein